MKQIILILSVFFIVTMGQAQDTYTPSAECLKVIHKAIDLQDKDGNQDTFYLEAKYIQLDCGREKYLKDNSWVNYGGIDNPLPYMPFRTAIETIRKDDLVIVMSPRPTYPIQVSGSFNVNSPRSTK